MAQGVRSSIEYELAWSCEKQTYASCTEEALVGVSVRVCVRACVCVHTTTNLLCMSFHLPSNQSLLGMHKRIVTALS